MSTPLDHAPGRHLALEGAYNIRDVGGYATIHGRRTRWRMLLRADSLHRLPEAAQIALIEHGVRTVIDLRRHAELGEAPNVFAHSDRVRYLHLPLIGETPLSDGEVLALPTIYRLILERCQPSLREILAALAEPSALPALVHCTAGKDRTGLIVALLLALAGVPAATIAADYALSAQCLTGNYLIEARRRAEVGGYTWEKYQLQLACPPDFMIDTLALLDKQHGGVEPFLQAIGLPAATLTYLRDALVEDVES